jgi:hypothetical protein
MNSKARGTLHAQDLLLIGLIIIIFLLVCSQDAVTHKNKEIKRVVVLHWEPTPGTNGNVDFR